MAKKVNKVALCLVLLVVIALIFVCFASTKPQITDGAAHSSIVITENKLNAQPAGGAKSVLTIFKTEFSAPYGTASSMLTVRP